MLSVAMTAILCHHRNASITAKLLCATTLPHNRIQSHKLQKDMGRR
jgi:hypothetical protein